MKKTIALLLSLVMVIGMVAFTGCGSKDDSSNGGDFKVGFICLHDEN